MNGRYMQFSKNLKWLFRWKSSIFPTWEESESDGYHCGQKNGGRLSEAGLPWRKVYQGATGRSSSAGAGNASSSKRTVVSNLAVLGEITISGSIQKVDELANSLQVCLDSGAKKVLIPSTSFVDFATVPAELMSAFQLIPYQSAEDAVFKALGVE